ncbi:hypothetical protein E7X19_19610 [Bacteroides fragilis]|uniref:hypothetical protein n=1 Tax=Bacteroides fragilis TaxID=817 RepID=UPI00109DC141|nr:hypothetical protein [Bacteroides fragilis]MBG9215051.1 hypothetical protein [Bacteroides fragilis]MBG9225856.1 hypothetical protein [Bacteroides fragilis]MCZ2505091.1 hypothetical protein [Bacteroides fragilis]THC61718.1 hypothetical protein E7X03_19675 [Bacteroides fragilis]THC69543.1 hypothetical protein E7X19_19610 [Bacteroides fragilis]
MAVHDVIPDRFTNLDVRDTLNAGGGSVGDHSEDYFSDRARINIWSWLKPIELDNRFPTLEQRKLLSGFFLSEVNTPWNIPVKVFKYRLPSSFFRIADFTGYRYKANPPSVRVQRIHFTDCPAGTDVRLSETDRTAVFNIEITFPEIPLWLFRNGVGQGNVLVSYGQYGTPDFKEIVVQPIQIEELCHGNFDEYATRYAGKTLTFQAVQHLNLPSRGYSETYQYYTLVSGGYLNSVEFLKFSVTIHRIRIISPNNPDDYDYRIPVSFLNPANNTNVTYTRIGTLVMEKEGFEYIRIENIRSFMTGMTLVLSYKTSGKPYANRIASLGLDNEWRPASGIVIYTIPSFNEGKWTLVFRRSGLGGDPIKEIIINGERNIG